MISASANFATAITAADREIRGYLKFNGTTVFRGADGLVSIQYNNALLDEERISVGCACSSYCVCEWYNNLTGVSLANSYFDAYVGVVESYAQTKPSGSIEDDTAVVEYIKLGRFYITDIERGKATTKVTAYDALSKASGQYTPTVVAGQSGYSVTDIIDDIKTQTGITGTITGTAYVDTIYASTGREQLGWLCSVLYKDGSSFVIDRTTNDLKAVNFVKNTADLSIDDTTIYMDGVEDKPTFTVNSVEMGTESNTYTAGNGLGISRFNPYANQTIVDSIYSDVHGMAFVPMRLHFRGDPRIELGDLLSVTTDNNTYLVTVMKQTLTFNGGMECTIECFGNTEAHYIMSQSPTQAEFKRVDNALADIAARIENPKNGIITTIKDADGYPTELLILNAMDKDDATSVWRFNINGLAHSTAYTGGTYSFALDDNGNINANLLRVGTITDANGYNSWNLDTGAFTITEGSINITTANDSDDIIKLNQQTSSVKRVTSEMTPSWLKNEYHYNNGTQDTTMGVLVKTNDSEPIIKAYRSIDRNPVGTKGSGDFWYSSELDHRFLRFRQAAQSYEESDATLRFSLSGADGTMGFYDENGTSRLSLSTRANDESQNGFTFRNASNVVTAKLGATTGITLGDGSTSYNRTLLDNTGLTFRNSSDVVTGNYPSNVNMTNLVYFQTYDFNGVSISAGTSGTRAAQQSTSVTKSGYRPIVARLSYVSDSSLANAVPFFGSGDESSLYVNFYRASGNSGTINTTVIVVYIRTEVTGVSW